MVSSPKTPPPPDPVATAAAQGGANRDTAITQQAMNFVNQVGPDGNLTYDKIGEDTFTDSLTGKAYTIPRYQATTTLSESGQRLKGLNDQTQENVATIGRDQSARIGTLLSNPVNLNNDAVESRLNELASKRLDPQFAKDEEALRTRLANQGIGIGSAAYNSEMERLSQARNDARNQLLLSGRGQAIQEILTERNQPLNEITALLSGSQVSQPNFISTPQTQLANTDYQGAVYNSYQGALKSAEMKQQSQNAMMGGLFGLAGTLGGSYLRGPFSQSDRRSKTDIEPVGKLDNGLTVYRYRFKAGGPFQIGLMADEVEEVKPHAVATLPNGFDGVDYLEATR